MLNTKFVRDTWLVFLRSLREGLRNPAIAFIFPLVGPTMLVVLFSQLYEGIVDLPGFPTDSYIEWVAAGGLLVTAMMGAGFSATSIVTDAKSGYLDRLRLLPVNPIAILLGRLIFEAVRILPAAVIVLALSLLMGAGLQNGVVSALAILALVMFWAVAWNGLFFVVALRTMNAQAPLALQPIFIPVFFMSTAFVPAAFMPGWLDTVSSYNPFNFVVKAGQGFMLDRFSWADLGLGIAIAATLLLVTMFFSVRSFNQLVRAD